MGRLTQTLFGSKMVLPWCHYNVCTQQRCEQANTAQHMHIGFWPFVLPGKDIVVLSHGNLPYQFNLLLGVALELLFSH